jgi:hypothetical protein
MPFMMSDFSMNPQMAAQQAQPDTLTLNTANGPGFQATPLDGVNPLDFEDSSFVDDPTGLTEGETVFYDDGSGDFTDDPANIYGEIEEPFPWWLLFVGLAIGYAVKGGKGGQ